jgi:hypothetical protein
VTNVDGLSIAIYSPSKKPTDNSDATTMAVSRKKSLSSKQPIQTKIKKAIAD